MYIFNSLWNSTVAYFQPAVKYCEEHKINRTTIGNVANDIGFIVVEGTKLAVSNAPPMAFQALATGGRAMLDLSHAALTSVHAWQFGSAGQNPQKSSATMVIDLASAAGEKLTELPGAAGEKLQDLSHSALKSMHAWNFATSDQDPQKSSATMVTELAGAAGEKLSELAVAAGNQLTGLAGAAGNQLTGLAGAAGEKLQDLSYSALKSMHAWNFATSDQDPQKSSATMVTELAGAAGEKLQDLGYSALTMLSDKATQAGSAVWAEVQVQAPALGQVLLQEAHHLASVATDAARDGLSLLSGNPLQFDAIEVHFEGAVAQAPHLNQSEVLPTSVLPAGLDGNAPVDFGAAVEGNDDFGGVQEVEQMGLNVMVAPEGQEDFDAYYAAQQAFEGMSLHNHLGHSTTVMAC